MQTPNELINQRLQLLQQEVQKAGSSVTMLTENLEKAKVHFNMVQGHFNEANYLLSQFNAKPEDAPAVPEVPAVPAPEAPEEQAQDGEANCESAQEAAE